MKTMKPGTTAAVLTLAVLASVALAQPARNSDCLECHSDKTLTMTDASGKEISIFVDERKFLSSVHRTNRCVDCHIDIKSTHPDDEIPARRVDCGSCHERQSASYGASVHGVALLAGKSQSAVCSDCHGSHEVLPPTSPASPLHYSKLAITCGKCHEEAARDVQDSIHGIAAARGIREAPTCTDCHSEHRIEGLKTTASVKISRDVCSKCHASERLNTKFNLPSDRVSSFFESYHGLAARYGSTTAANCGSCHGVHKILPSSHPDSTIHKDRLLDTCGKCHPGANEKFAQGKIHLDLRKAGGEIAEQLNWWVRKIYFYLIFGVIGGMLLHNALIFYKKIAAMRRAQVRPIVRMNRSQRVQHFLLLSSFIVLAITGFALRFPDSWIAWCLGSSESFRSWSHRIAGVVLIAVSFCHVAYVIFTPEGRQLMKDFMPAKKDITDAWQQMRYIFGLSRARPKFGRFGYAEKMEYWAVVWGTIIMGITGLMIWMKMDVTQFLPRWTIDVATTIHYYEAILACLAIIVWHFYHVMFDPDVYPMNWAWWDGKVSAKWHAHEHPLDSTASTLRDCTENPKAPATRDAKSKAENEIHFTI